ncbi:arsenate-mycothiol transferase ArsC [Croceivirga radicis]|uniref:arsenate-mycothiol transferase ArsC n=1 Tax=Croceivirga radicis TaxID=1929488 RepID=UPI000255B35D|nr:protein-tyrosine-phosphatase [Croceivirga radicis]
MSLLNTLQTFVDQLATTDISPERKDILQPLISYIQANKDANKPIRLNLICTHNSRRSHLSQIWAQTMAHYYGIANVFCYSGGTEATAMYPKIGETLIFNGFTVTKLSADDNPVYAIKYAQNEPAVIAFSKRMDHEFNPAEGFAAIMTCSQADQGCPFVPGAEKRIPITYEDPKVFDGTPEQDKMYKERSKQIATEMKYIFSQIQ